MDLISELVYIISQNPPNSLDLLIPHKTKTRKLYDAVLEKKIATDEDAARLIYKSDAKDKRFLMLKRNLIQKLTDLVLLSDHTEINRHNFVQLQFKCERELNIVKKLLVQNVYHNAEKITSKVFNTATKNHLIEIQLECAKIFRTIYSLMGNLNETIKHNNNFELFSRNCNYLNEARGMWQILYCKIKYTAAFSNEIVELTENYIKKIKIWLNEYDSPFLELYLYRIQIIYYKNLADLNSTLTTLIKVDKLLKDFPYLKNKEIILELNLESAIYYRSVRKLKTAQKYIDKCLEVSDYRAFDKFLVQSWNFDIQIKKKEYKKAAIILHQVKETSQFKYLEPPDKAAWLIKEGYLYFIFKMNNETNFIPTYLPDYTSGIQVNKFILTCKAANKDKKGYNPLLQIITILLQLLKKTEKLDFEGNKMLVYFYRHLKDINQLRTRYFFYNFSKTASFNFVPDDLVKKTNAFNKQMDKMDVANIYDYCELIPYELLWESAKELLISGSK